MVKLVTKLHSTAAELGTSGYWKIPSVPSVPSIPAIPDRECLAVGTKHVRHHVPNGYSSRYPITSAVSLAPLFSLIFQCWCVQHLSHNLQSHPNVASRGTGSFGI